MGQILGYIDNTPVYDNRMRSKPPYQVWAPDPEAPDRMSYVPGNGPSGEQRFHNKIKREKWVNAEPCEILVPYRSERGNSSFLLMDGVTLDGELIAFHERGNGIYLIRPGAYRYIYGTPTLYAGGLRQHHCHATGCTTDVPPKLFMCRKHWSMVPKDLQDLVWKHYQPGQELGQATPTREYLDVTERAIAAVAEVEAEKERARKLRDAQYEEKRRRGRELDQKARGEGGMF